MGLFRKTRSKSCGAPERMEAEAVVLTGRLESSESAQSQLRFGGHSWLSASSGQQRPPSLSEDADTATARFGDAAQRPIAQQQQGAPELDGASLAQREPLYGSTRYRKVRDLNKGTSGFVQLAMDLETGERVAIKFIPRGRQHSDLDMKEVSRELLNQRMCSMHPNIVQLREVFLTEHHLAVAMEYADGGDLSEYIDQQYQRGTSSAYLVLSNLAGQHIVPLVKIDFMTEPDARCLFQQLIVAVDYCHKLGIANRDIKLDNMLLHGPWPRPQLKLCDFGFSKNEVMQSVSKSTCGTPEYMAPEVLFEMQYCGTDADVWSCGVALYVLLTGVFPFARPDDEDGNNAKQMRHMFRRIIEGDYYPIPDLSPECQHLIHHMFRPNPEERCTIEDIMRHPWFVKDLPPQLAHINSYLLHAKAAEHRECRESMRELELMVQSAAIKPADQYPGAPQQPLPPPLVV